MRQRFAVQLDLGITPIEKILIPAKSRDEMPPVLAGLQWIFVNPEISEEIFALLEAKITPPNNTGRPGMDLWQILVLGTVRLALDCDYDRLEYLVQYDTLLRGILGIPRYWEHDDPNDPTKHFTARTLSNNVCLLDEDLLREINFIVAAHGREIFKKKRTKKSR